MIGYVFGNYETYREDFIKNLVRLSVDGKCDSSPAGYEPSCKLFLVEFWFEVL